MTTPRDGTYGATVWNAFLPIRQQRGKGKASGVLLVLGLVRRCVLPLIRRLERGVDLCSFSFLIHDRASGVPCLKSDKRAFVHLRLTLNFRVVSKTPRLRIADHNAKSVRALLPKAWEILRQVHPTPEEDRVHRDLDAQAAWYLDFLERRADLTDDALLQEIGQHLHFFANMSQLAVS